MCSTTASIVLVNSPAFPGSNGGLLLGAARRPDARWHELHRWRFRQPLSCILQDDCWVWQLRSCLTECYRVRHHQATGQEAARQGIFRIRTSTDFRFTYIAFISYTVRARNGQNVSSSWGSELMGDLGHISISASSLAAMRNRKIYTSLCGSLPLQLIAPITSLRIWVT